MKKSNFSKIKILLSDLLLYAKLKLSSSKGFNNEKTIRIELNSPQLYHRYFYNLLKTLKIGGYQIYYPMDFKTFRNLRNGDNYIALLFKDKELVNLNGNREDKKQIVLRDDIFSANYYKTYFIHNNEELDIFHIPMSFHPFMYSKGLWNKKIFESSPLRINSVFCFGNFDVDAYKLVHQSKFEIIDRISLLNYFKEKPNFVNIISKNHLKKIISQKADNKFIFSDKSIYQIPMQDIRLYLAKFRFYLCCPGVFAPLSHNFIESVSAGCIPIIQKSYADTIYPPLEHKKNAIIFEDFNHLDVIVNKILFTISDEQYLQMKKNIQKYYEENLHPKAVADLIVKNLDKKTIYLNASQRSIKFHEKIVS